jgi:UPF0755 protein
LTKQGAKLGNSSRLRNSFLFVLLALVVFAGGVVVTSYLAWYRPYKSFPENQKFVLIDKGTPSYQISQTLQREGVVRHWYWFLAYLKVMRRSAHLQAGEYLFEQPIPVAQVAEKLIRGQVYYHEITIPEGYSLFEIADLVQQKGLLASDDFLQATRQVNKLSDLVSLNGNLEGYLFPDTYRLTRGTRSEEFVGMMTSKFKDIYGKKLELPLKQSPYSLNEIMTMASLIEKETAVDEERPLVAAVFYNRLKRQMPLQCDPTVIYAAKLKGDYRGKIFQSDLDLDSPYNTYIRVGLPPAPIANPGIRSIEAALAPAHGDYLYFVSNNNGGHVFSKTLEEHQKAVAAYRKESARKSHS